MCSKAHVTNVYLKESDADINSDNDISLNNFEQVTTPPAVDHKLQRPNTASMRTM